ncbi:hypothetical protein B0H10DRAFT_2006080 [Mycena sp. CBHHK59/15]|nr:hypothetical protein B0H10DRAFT_2006080 [Mycena sp. CBHHK59/15]
MIGIPMARKQIPKNVGFNSEPALKTLQNEFHRHAQFIADCAVGTKVTPGITREQMVDSSQLAINRPCSTCSSSGHAESTHSIHPFLQSPLSRAGFSISAIPVDVILEIFSIVRVIGHRAWWKDCSSFASTSRHVRACCLPVLFRRTHLRPRCAPEKPIYDPGDKILRCFRHCSFSAGPEVTVQPSTLDILVSLLSRMQSLESFEMQYTTTVPFSALGKVLTGLPLLRRADIWHSPCPGISPFSEFPGDIRHFSFSPAPKVVSPEEVHQRLVFDPPDDAEVSTVSAALHSTLRQCQATLETLDVPIWCFPLEQLGGTPWIGLHILSLRGYLPADRRPASGILDLFPPLESLEIEVVRTDPSLIEHPQYLWVDSERARFPSQLKHLSLVDVGTMDPIFRHLPPDLGSLSIIDTRSRKYGRSYEVPFYDDNYRTCLTQTEITSVVARNPQSFAGLTYLRMSISTGRQSSHWYMADGRFCYRLDLHFQRERFLLPAPEDFADALSPIRNTLATLCIEQPHWQGMPRYPKHLTAHGKAAQKQWFDFLDAWLRSLRQHMPVLRRGSFGFELSPDYDRWQSFILCTSAGRSLNDSTPPGFTRWHTTELTDYDKNFVEGEEDFYFHSEHVTNPLLLRYSNRRHHF